MSREPLIDKHEILTSGDYVAAAIVIAGEEISRALGLLGNADAATPMGAIEGHAAHTGERLEGIASSLNGIASAIAHATHTGEKLESVASSLDDVAGALDAIASSIGKAAKAIEAHQ